MEFSVQDLPPEGKSYVCASLSLKVSSPVPAGRSALLLDADHPPPPLPITCGLQGFAFLKRLTALTSCCVSRLVDRVTPCLHRVRKHEFLLLAITNRLPHLRVGKLDKYWGLKRIHPVVDCVSYLINEDLTIEVAAKYSQRVARIWIDHNIIIVVVVIIIIIAIVAPRQETGMVPSKPDMRILPLVSIATVE